MVFWMLVPSGTVRATFPLRIATTINGSLSAEGVEEKQNF